jgi:uncharacterized protein (TIGR00730 family)
MAAVCVFCASSERIDERYILLAEQVGRRVAAGGHTLVSGGGRVSMMGAVARAARAGGAVTIGVIPQALVDRQIAHIEGSDLVVVDTMRERKQIMDERCDAFVALPGGIGALEELFEAWTAGSLGMHDKPVIVLDPYDYYGPLWAYLTSLVDRGFVRQAALDHLHRVATVDDAFAVIERSDGSVPAGHATIDGC